MKRFKKYFCFLVAGLILLGSIGVVEPVYAANDDYSFETLANKFNSWYNSSYSGYVTFDQMNYIVLEANDTVVCYVGGSIVYDSSNSTNFKIRVNGFKAGDSGTRGAQVWRWENGAWKDIGSAGSPAYMNISNITNYWHFNFSDADYEEYGVVIENGGPRVLACSQDVYDSEGNVYIPVCDFGWDEILNPDLGYITNLVYKSLRLTDKDGGLTIVDGDSVRYVFEYGSVSSVGNVLDDSYMVRHFMELEVHDGVDVGECKLIRSYGRIWMGDYNCSNHRFEFDRDYLQNFYESCNFNGLGWWESNFYHTQVVHYFQLVRLNSNGSREYGNLLRFDQNFREVTAVTPEGVVVPGYSDDVNVSAGSGTNFTDAEINANNKPIYEYDSSGVVADLESILGFIGAFPAVIGSLLSFLPVEYQTLIYISIVVAIVLVVWKAARG